ncbi:MAG: hypothetical protein RBS68_13450 [Anaerolineales bacterium]|jgi:hypothetical protein|nr:hypothetical protein [Anaerolineales bacterium]
MTTFEKTLLREIADLPESRQVDVLAFVRYLKFYLRDEQAMTAGFEKALKTARETAEKYEITEADIENEIRAVRDGK